MAARTPSATSACDIVAETTSPPTANLYRPVQPSPPGDRRKDVVGKKSSEHAVPHAMQQPDRAPKERYYDPDFFQLEAEQLWPRIWQMACRLRSEEHTSELQSLMRISYAVFCLQKKQK